MISIVAGCLANHDRAHSRYEDSVGGCVGRFFFQSPEVCQKLGRGLDTREIQRDKHAERLFFGCGGAELLQ